MRLGLLVFLLAVLATPAFTQPAAPPVADDPDQFDKELDAMFVDSGLTSDQAAARAGNVSPTVQRRVAEIEEQTAVARQTYLSGVPQIGGKLSYTRNSFVAPFNFASGSAGSALAAFGLDPSELAFNFLQNYFLAEATVNVPLSDYFYRYPTLVGAAKEALDVARISRTSAMLDAGQDARTTYYQWLQAKLQVVVAHSKVTQAEATLAQAEALAEVQRMSRADVLRIESNEAEAKQEAARADYNAVLGEEKLRVLLQIPDDQALAIGEDIRKDVPIPGQQQVDEMMKHVTTHRLDYQVLVEGIDARDKQRKAEYPGYLPRLSLFGVFDYANPNQRIFPQEDVYTGTWSLGIQATWNINDALTADNNRVKLQAQTDELRADEENFLRQTRIEVLTAQQNVQLALADLQTTAKGLKASEESYRVRKELLDAGRSTAVEMVDAENDLANRRISALNARIELRLAIAELVHALGDDTSTRH